MEPHRGYTSESDTERGLYGGEQSGYDSEGRERGRHGAPTGDVSGYVPQTGYVADQPAFGHGEPDPHYVDPTSGASGPIGPRSGEPMPPLPPDQVESRDSGETSRRSVEALDVAARRRSAAGDAPYTSATYGSTDYGPTGTEYAPAGTEYAPAGTEYAPPSGYPPSTTYFGGSPAGEYSSHVPEPGRSNAPNSDISPRSSVYQSRRLPVALIIAAVVVVFEIAPIRLLLSAVLADQAQAPGIVAATFLITGLPAIGYGLYEITGRSPSDGWSSWTRPPLVFLLLGAFLFVCAALAA